MTIYHRNKNKDTGFYEYNRHFIPCVHWHTEIRKAGVRNTDEYTIRIPEEYLHDYASPDIYAGLDSDKIDRKWTIQDKDLFIMGECKLSIKSVKDLEKMQKPYGGVNSWKDNRFGGLPHIRIGGAA